MKTQSMRISSAWRLHLGLAGVCLEIVDATLILPTELLWLDVLVAAVMIFVLFLGHAASHRRQRMLRMASAGRCLECGCCLPWHPAIPCQHVVRRKCAIQCGYNLRGVTSGLCPECGNHVGPGRPRRHGPRIR